MVEGVFACDRNGAVTHMNVAGLRLRELSSAAAVSRAPVGAGLEPVHPDGRPFSPAELPLLRALAGEVIVEEDGVLESPGNHRPVFLRSSAAPIREANGAIAGAVAVARDVTEVADVGTSELHRVVIRREDPAPLTVRADSARTRQALRNLLSNALKYSPAGGTIEVVLSVDRERAEAQASVRDYGIGIPAQRQGGIFRLFYRAHTDTPYDYGGMGVGLYIDRKSTRLNSSHQITS